MKLVELKVLMTGVQVAQVSKNNTSALVYSADVFFIISRWNI